MQTRHDPVCFQPAVLGAEHVAFLQAAKADFGLVSAPPEGVKNRLDAVFVVKPEAVLLAFEARAGGDEIARIAAARVQIVGLDDGFVAALLDPRAGFQAVAARGQIMPGPARRQPDAGTGSKTRR